MISHLAQTPYYSIFYLLESRLDLFSEIESLSSFWMQWDIPQRTYLSPIHQ
jgi:hypothetical protein